MVGRIISLFLFCTIALGIVFFHELTAIFFGADRVRILIVAVLFVNIIFRYTIALALGVTAGFFLDQLSFTPAHWSIAAVLTLLATNALFIHFFTNRSLWTLLILGGVGTVIAFFVHALFVGSFVFFFASLGAQLLSHTILFTLLFYAVNMFTARLKPYIIVRAPEL